MRNFEASEDYMDYSSILEKIKCLDDKDIEVRSEDSTGSGEIVINDGEIIITIDVMMIDEDTSLEVTIRDDYEKTTYDYNHFCPTLLNSRIEEAINQYFKK